MPKARKYGLEIPDYPRIHKNDEGRWVVEEDDLDWDEFFTIAKNEYEPGVGQINGRKHAQEAVQWVRDTIEADNVPAGGQPPQAAD